MSSSVGESPYASSLQCYICFLNKAHELQNEETEAQKEPEKQSANDVPSILCRGCKLQRYCSLKHLAEDQTHRDFCQVLVDLQKSLNIEHPLLLTGVITGRNQLQKAIAQLMLAARVKLRRLLTCREQEIIGYPEYCVVCYSLEVLTACKGCAGVAYCSNEHRIVDRAYHTVEVCRTLASYHNPYRYLQPKLEIEHLMQCTIDIQHSHLIDAFHHATGLQVKSQPWRSLKDYELFATCSSFSGIASICLALTNISFKAAPHEILSVYIIGAKEEHLLYFRDMHLKFFFLQYQDICQLDLYFIGHKLQQRAGEDILTFELQGCKRKVVKRTFPMTFASFAKAHKVDPVLIIIYNPDFAAMDSVTEGIVERKYPHAVQASELDNYNWQACLLETLYTYGVPICFTSCTLVHSCSDITCVNVLAGEHEIAVKRVYNCSENPYREILPLHNPCPDDEETVIYANNYLEVIFTSIDC